MGFLTRNALHSVDEIEQKSREISHDLTNAAARLDVLSRLHKNMRDDYLVNGNGTKGK
jgi:hypothetical protein